MYLVIHDKGVVQRNPILNLKDTWKLVGWNCLTIVFSRIITQLKRGCIIWILRLQISIETKQGKVHNYILMITITSYCSNWLNKFLILTFFYSSSRWMNTNVDKTLYHMALSPLLICSSVELLQLQCLYFNSCF